MPKSNKLPFTHLNARGEAHMVDIGTKSRTHRRAVASGEIRMAKQTLDAIVSNSHKKGDVLGIARIAGIMAAKQTANLIPLSHPIAISHVQIELSPMPAESMIRVTAIVETVGPTGVEIEALHSVQVALLTIYDMCKSADRFMVMSEIGLLEKTGGKSGDWYKSGESGEVK